MQQVFNDEVMVLTISILASYIVQKNNIKYFKSYFMADAYFPSIGIYVSGTTALAALGIFLSAFGRSKAYPETDHAVETLWFFNYFRNYFCFAAESCVF